MFKESVSENSYCCVIWNFGRNAGEPINVLKPVNVVSGTPPSTVGFLGIPGTMSPVWFRPKGSCWAYELSRLKPTRNSFTRRGERMRVQPIAAPLAVSFSRPNADGDVASASPPKLPGMKRERVVQL